MWILDCSVVKRIFCIESLTTRLGVQSVRGRDIIHWLEMAMFCLIWIFLYSTITLISSLTLKVSVYERDSAHELLSLSLLLYLLRNVQSLPAETPAGHGKLSPRFCLFVCMHLSLVMSVCVGFVFVSPSISVCYKHAPVNLKYLYPVCLLWNFAVVCLSVPFTIISYYIRYYIVL